MWYLFLVLHDWYFHTLINTCIQFCSIMSLTTASWSVGRFESPHVTESVHLLLSRLRDENFWEFLNRCLYFTTLFYFIVYSKLNIYMSISALFHSNVFYLLFFNSKNTLPIMLPYPYIIKTFRGIIGIQKHEYLMDLIWWIWKYANTQNTVISNSSIFTL